MDAVDQAALVAKGEVTPSSCWRPRSSGSRRLDPALNAVTITLVRPRPAAGRRPDLPDGPFRGVPFLLKDLYTTFAGQTLSNGNVALRGGRRSSTPPTRRWSAATGRPGSSIAGRTNSPEMGSLPTTAAGGVGPDAQPVGPRPHARRVERRVRRPRSPPGWCRSPTPPTAAAASASRRRLRARRAQAEPGPDHASARSRAEAGLGVEHCVSRTVRDSAALLDAVRGPGRRRHRDRRRRPTRPYADEVGADPGRLRIGLLDPHPRGGFLHDDCVAAVRVGGGDARGARPRRRAGLPRRSADETLTPTFMALWATQMAMAAAGFGGDARPGADRGRRRAGQLGPGRVRRAAQRRRLRHRPGRHATRSAARCSSGGPTAGTSCSRRRSASRRRCSSEFAPVAGDPSAPMRRAGRFVPVHAGVQHERPAGDQPAAALERRRPPDRRPARRRLRPRGRPHPRRRPARGGPPLGRPPPGRDRPARDRPDRARVGRLSAATAPSSRRRR